MKNESLYYQVSKHLRPKLQNFNYGLNSDPYTCPQTLRLPIPRLMSPDTTCAQPFPTHLVKTSWNARSTRSYSSSLHPATGCTRTPTSMQVKIISPATDFPSPLWLYRVLFLLWYLSTYPISYLLYLTVKFPEARVLFITVTWQWSPVVHKE